MSLTYILVSFAAAICSVFAALYVWNQRAVTGSKSLTILLLGSAIWALLSGFYELASSVEVKLFLTSIIYPSIVLVPVSLLVFVLQYSGFERFVTRRFLAVLIIVPVLTIAMVWTNSIHYLYWTEIRWDMGTAIPVAEYIRGPMFWVWMLFAYGMVLIGTLILLYFLHSASGIFRRQNATLILAVTAPWIGNILYLLHLTPWPNLDTTALGFVVTGLAMSWGVVGLRISNVVPVARKSVLNSMTDAVLVLDQNKHLVDLNPAAIQLISKTADELVGEHVDLALAAYPDLLRQLNHVVPDDDGRVNSETNLGTIEDPILYDLRIAQVSNKRGISVGTSIVLRDLSELKQAEESRRILENQLQHSQKLESLGVLAGGIAHDFNNMLLGISGNAELALHEIASDSPARDMLVNIENVSFRAAELCRQLLAYSGKGRFVIEPMDVNQMIADMRQILDVSVLKVVTLSFELAEDLPLIKADIAQMQQLIMNLMINAAEALTDGVGTVTVRTRKITCDQHYLDTMDIGTELQPGSYVSLEVEDSGIGMDEETMRRIFDPFFTTKFTGRGLGMSAALGVIQGHGGGMRIISKPGFGTRFKIILPTTKEELTSREKPVRKEQWKGAGTVLIVDDEKMLRDVARSMLEKLEFSVKVATDGLDAIDQYQKNRNDIVCVLLDLTMPRMDGEECFQRLREIDSNLSIVIMSGYNEQEVSQKFVGEGLGAFLHKPFRERQLSDAMQSALNIGDTDNFITLDTQLSVPGH